MRRLLLLFILVPQMWATWGQGVHAISAACTTTSSTCSVSVSPTAGSAIAIGLSISINNSISSVSDNATGGSSTYAAHPTNCAVHNAGGTVATDCTYCLTVKSGVTSITVTRSSATSATWRVMAQEFTLTAGNVAVFDTANSIDDSTSAGTQPTPTLTLTGSDDAIAQIIRAPSANISSIGTPYSVGDITGGNGQAFNFNTSSGASVNWTLAASSAATASAIALKEVASSIPSQPWIIQP